MGTKNPLVGGEGLNLKLELFLKLELNFQNIDLIETNNFLTDDELFQR